MNIHPPNSSHQQHVPQPLMSVLSDELIEEILSQLPVKDLVRMKCVCKSWNTIITDPNFVKLHLQRSSRNPHLALTKENLDYHPHNCSVIPFSVSCLIENPLITIDDPYYQLNDKNCHVLIGSCNGLLCLLGYSFTFEYRENWFCLWNPATRSISEKLGSFRTRCNTLDYVFGCDNSTGTYKVLAFHLNVKSKKNSNSEANKASQRSQVKIFNVGDNSWRNIQSFPVVPLHSSNGVYLRGTFNWLSLRNKTSRYYYCEAITIEQFVIVSLDLATETYTELLLPQGFDEVPQDEPLIGVLMDTLCLSYDFKRTHLIIWQMKEFGVKESWTQLLRIPYQDLQMDEVDDFEYYPPMIPLWLSENADTIVLANEEEGQAIIYNRKDNRVERTRFDNEEIQWIHAKNHVESLVSPK